MISVMELTGRYRFLSQSHPRLMLEFGLMTALLYMAMSKLRAGTRLWRSKKARNAGFIKGNSPAGARPGTPQKPNHNDNARIQPESHPTVKLDQWPAQASSEPPQCTPPKPSHPPPDSPTTKSAGH
jgi:hypothetical protein